MAGATKSAAGRRRAVVQRKRTRLCVRGDPRVELVLRLGVDHRADIGRDLARIADHELARRARDHLDHAVGHVLLHAQQPQRRAALPGGAERRGDDIVGHLLGQRGRVDDHRVDAAGLGDQRHDRPVLGGERAVDQPRDLGRAGEGDAGDARGRRPAPRRPCRRRARAAAPIGGTPASCSSRTAAAAISGVCSAGLATTALPAASAAATWPVKIASGKFHGLMQTNTPRPRWCSSLVSPVGPGMRSRRERTARLAPRSSGRSRPPRALRRAHRRASCRLRPQQRDQRVAVAARRDRRRVRARPRAPRPASPSRPRNPPRCDLARDRASPRHADRAVDRRRRARASRMPSTARAVRLRAPAARAAPRGSRGRRTRRPPNSSAPAHRDRAAAECADAARARRPRSSACGRFRIVGDRHRRIGRDRHERRVGAVLQQPPHQIGEQVAMAADRRVDAAGRAGVSSHQRLVERLAHAVQALELVALDAARLLDHARDGQRVVGGELRIETRPRGEQLARAGHVAEVGHRLAGEHRIVGKPALLRALDLGVPVGALDQAHHQPAVERARGIVAPSRSPRRRASDRPAPRARSRPSRRARDRRAPRRSPRATARAGRPPRHRR